MFALLSLAAASVADEHTAFDGVIQFDALQNVPGTSVPGTVISTCSFTTSCLGSCTATVTANLQNTISRFSGIATAIINIVCGAACTVRGRSLLQTTGATATVTITGATVAQLQTLQNNIAIGNLVDVGIPSTTIVTGATPVIPATALAALGGPTALTPSNPASPTAMNVCSNAALARLVCISRATQALAQSTCAGTLATVIANGVSAVCCSCTVKARRALQQVGNQVVATNPATTYAQLCAAAPRGYPGCGKRGSKKGLLGLLGLLGLIPLLLCLLICCLCCLRRKRRGQAMLFSQTAVPAPIPAPLPHVHAEPHLHAGPDFHVHP